MKPPRKRTPAKENPEVGHAELEPPPMEFEPLPLELEPVPVELEPLPLEDMLLSEKELAEFAAEVEAEVARLLSVLPEELETVPLEEIELLGEQSEGGGGL